MIVTEPTDTPTTAARRDWPTFTALTYDGEAVGSDDSLDSLLAQLADAAGDPRHGLDEATIWRDGEQVVAVVRTDGTIIRLDGPEPHQTRSDEREDAPRRRRSKIVS